MKRLLLIFIIFSIAFFHSPLQANDCPHCYVITKLEVHKTNGETMQVFSPLLQAYYDCTEKRKSIDGIEQNNSGDNLLTEFCESVESIPITDTLYVLPEFGFVAAKEQISYLDLDQVIEIRLIKSLTEGGAGELVSLPLAEIKKLLQAKHLQKVSLVYGINGDDFFNVDNPKNDPVVSALLYHCHRKKEWGSIELSGLSKKVKSANVDLSRNIDTLQFFICQEMSLMEANKKILAQYGKKHTSDTAITAYLGYLESSIEREIAYYAQVTNLIEEKDIEGFRFYLKTQMQDKPGDMKSYIQKLTRESTRDVIHHKTIERLIRSERPPIFMFEKSAPILEERFHAILEDLDLIVLSYSWD